MEERGGRGGSVIMVFGAGNPLLPFPPTPFSTSFSARYYVEVEVKGLEREGGGDGERERERAWAKKVGKRVSW